jgi:hypothetical protein
MTKENGDRVLRFVPRPDVADVSSGTPEGGKSAFMAFGTAVRAGDLGSAGKHLSALMDLSETDGFAAAKFFQERMQADPETLSKTMRIREAIVEGKTNAAMAAMMECFGLDGLHSLRAVHALQRMLE